ncbi:hypothetical protein FNV43_RR24481 [Rhamnella rubrinervis]|uniref:Uncharacterized protein n=1 Tax=Rhamnella rubrinervis TaxID=2594499 RepID=A0A8K0DSC3_9ROSA|nr:hypothetical protein FNV43_RR24481 [Rhamnella rubrinervis]
MSKETHAACSRIASWHIILTLPTFTGMSNNSSSDREIYEDGGNEVKYLGDTSDYGSTPDTSGNLHLKEVSLGLRSHIEFAKNQPEATKNYKNLLLPDKIVTYFSHETLLSEGPSTQLNITTEGMKKKLNKMRKSGAGEKKGSDKFESPQSKRNKPFETPLAPLTPSTLSSRLSNLTSESPSRNLNRPFASNSSFGLPALLPDQRAILSEFEKKVKLMDNEVKLKEGTIHKLQDSLSKSKVKIKELESDVRELEEMNKKMIKDLEDTMMQLEKKSVRVLQELESLKSSTNETIEVETPSRCVGIRDTPARDISGAEDPTA